MAQADEKLPPGTNYCRCAGCEEPFNSVHAFDRHRVGSANERRCLQPTEMVEIGMKVSERGYWVTKSLDLSILTDPSGISRENSVRESGGLS